MSWLIESLVQALLEVFGDAILDGLLRSRNPIANAIGNVVVAILFAALFAVVSLAIYPRHLLSSPELRLAALVMIPVANGLFMAFVGRHFVRVGRLRSGYEHFLPAFAFSLTFGVMRLVWAR